MGTILVGKKKFFSRKKNRDFYQLQVLVDGNAGEGKWCETVFCSSDCYRNCSPSDFGVDLTGYEWGSDPDNPNSKYPTIVGYKIKK